MAKEDTKGGVRLAVIVALAMLVHAEGAWAGRPRTDFTAPSVPAGVNATAAKCSEIQVSWAAASDTTGGSGVVAYRVYRDGSQTPLSWAIAPTTSFADGNLTGSSTHRYQIDAVDWANNSSARSAYGTATTPSCTSSGSGLQPLGTISGLGTLIGFAGDSSVVAITSTLDRLTIVDVADPTNPRVAGSLDLGATGGAVAVHDGFAYVVQVIGTPSQTANLLAVDIRTPAAPRIASSVRLLGTPKGKGAIAIAGTLLYVHATDAGLHVVDISRPSAPQILGHASAAAGGWRVAVDSGSAVSFDPISGYAVFDVRDSARPTLTATLARNAGGFAVQGTRLYEADYTRIDVIDTSSATWKMLAKVPVTTYDIAVVGTRGFVATDVGVSEVDLSNPTSAKVVHATTLGSGVGELALAGPYLLAKPDSQRLRIIATN